MSMPRYNITKKQRIFVEIALALILIGGFVVLYHYRGDNFEAYLAGRFPTNGLRLARVMAVSENTDIISSYTTQNVVIQFFTGDLKGQTTTGQQRLVSSSTQNSYLRLGVGEKVLVARSADFTNETFYVTDRYRLPQLLLIILLFVIIAVIFGRIRGFTSIVGLGISVLILGYFVVPRILAGGDALLICLEGAVAIAIASLYLAHGFNKRTTIALVGTLITLAISTALSVWFVSATRLIGLTTDESFYLAIGNGITLSLRGLLLGGIIIGALGVLDDVTIGQTTAIQELKNAGPTLGRAELYRRSVSLRPDTPPAPLDTFFVPLY